MDKKTLVLGATTNTSRYSNIAVHRLHRNDVEAVPVGIREGEIDGTPILHGQPQIDDVHTITLYLNPERQKPYYDYILGLKPKRIIFNPGTENPELIRLAKQQGIETEIACTLVMLSTGSY